MDKLIKSIIDRENYSIRRKDDIVYVFKGDFLVADLATNAAYNYLYMWNSCVESIKAQDGRFVLTARLYVPYEVNSADGLMLSFAGIPLETEYIDCRHDEEGRWYILFRGVIDVREFIVDKKTQGVHIVYDDGNYVLQLKLKWRFIERGDLIQDHPDLPMLSSDIILDYENDNAMYFAQTSSNYIGYTKRGINHTDAPEEDEKLVRAMEEANSPEGRKYKDTVVFFEKHCSRYEESASVLFEYCIDHGIKNVVYIIDKSSDQYDNIPEKYRDYVVDRFSYEHYLYFFAADTFIATESMNHSLELNVYNNYARKRISDMEYNYVFLQHGVMYMYCLEGRNTFVKGKGMPVSTRMVVSSQLEADHVIEYGKFDQRDMILSGLPKYDRAVKNADADRIVIMPTSRNFEYSVIRNRTEESMYYNFVKKIIEAVPDNLKDKVIFIPHPLVVEFFGGTELEKYMPGPFSYNEILKTTKLLITDYSSISYDAFYRGSNVLFAWQEKEYCLEAMNLKLMLEEETAFGDVSYDYDTLSKQIADNYYCEQKPEYIEKYSHIVEFRDGRNTERCFKDLYRHGLLKKGLFRKKIKKNMIQDVANRIYSGHPKHVRKFYVIDKDRVLTKGVDYTVSYENNIGPGMATMIIQGINRYKGTVRVQFKIRAAMEQAHISNIRYDDNGLDLSDIQVELNGEKLVRDKSFRVGTISYRDNVALVDIHGKGVTGGKQLVHVLREGTEFDD